MPSDCVSYKDTGYFSNLICDYLDQKEQLKPFYNRFPSIEQFKQQIAEKMSFSIEKRKVLTQALLHQYQSVSPSKKTLDNIKILKNTNTFTVTTGHQLNLFTGPLYFLYKIVSTINLCHQLSEKYPTYNFVPVYWMATEDHDFHEINFFNFRNKKFLWNAKNAGVVGKLPTIGLEQLLEVFSKILENNTNASKLTTLFKKAYLKHNTLSEATRYLANQLFGDKGLVIIDADHASLKQLFVPYLKRELFENKAYKYVTKTSKKLQNIDASYPIQVHPRSINLFYINEGIRERIVFENNAFKVLNTPLRFSASELVSLLTKNPERFSPNVIMRPLYQEVILPNLCYIGGSGELAYWLQLKDFFDAEKIPFPVLLLRNSALLIPKKKLEKLERLDVSIKSLFLNRTSFINQYLRQISSIGIDFSKQKKYLQSQFKELYTLAQQTDPSFLGAVKAQEVKQLKGLKNLEKRLLKAQKRKLSDQITRAEALQEAFFPRQNLQERSLNFSEFYEIYGSKFIQQLFTELNPMALCFKIIKLP